MPELFTFSIFTPCVYLLWKGVVSRSFSHLINGTHALEFSFLGWLCGKNGISYFLTPRFSALTFMTLK